MRLTSGRRLEYEMKLRVIIVTMNRRIPAIKNLMNRARLSFKSAMALYGAVRPGSIILLFEALGYADFFMSSRDRVVCSSPRYSEV